MMNVWKILPQSSPSRHREHKGVRQKMQETLRNKYNLCDLRVKLRDLCG